MQLNSLFVILALASILSLNEAGTIPSGTVTHAPITSSYSFTTNPMMNTTFVSTDSIRNSTDYPTSYPTSTISSENYSSSSFSSEKTGNPNKIISTSTPNHLVSISDSLTFEPRTQNNNEESTEKAISNSDTDNIVELEGKLGLKLIYKIFYVIYFRQQCF